MDYKPNYINLFYNGSLKERAILAKNHLKQCCLCPHECSIDRTRETGFCKASDKAIVASFGPHFGEETELVGTNGSGTIFFGYCNLRCVFCQNYELSFGGEGEVTSDENLAEIMIKLQDKYRCHNINFVSPTHFVANILNALLLAVEKGLRIPLVYNCGGYEKADIIELLNGVIDIYMPDFKYDAEGKGQKYSLVKDYPAQVKKSLIKMDRQVGGIKVDNKGIAYRGLFIRHLMMPGGLDETKKILDFISGELSPDCLVNIMDQYYPAHQAHRYTELNQRVTKEAWQEAMSYAKKLGLRTVM